MGRPPRREQPAGNKVQAHVTDDELAAIDDWRFARRIGSRSEAIRQLIALGLGGEGQPAHLVAAVPAEEGVFEAAKRTRR